MPRPRKPAKRRYRPRGSGSISYCARLDRFEARVPRAMGRTASYHETKGQAATWLAQMIGQHQDRQALPGADEKLGAYLGRWGKRMETVFGPARLDHARQMARHAEPLWPIALADLRFNHVADWVAGMLRGGLAPSTVALHKQLLAQSLGDLVPDVLLSNPAARSVRLPRPTATGDPAHFEELEAQRLLKTAQGTPGYPLWRLLLGTGLRIGEALGLTWERIDLEGGTAEIVGQWGKRANAATGTKSGKARSVVLAQSVLAALLAMPHRNGYLFPGIIHDHPIRQETARAWFRAATLKADLPDLTPHALRHSFASIALSRGVPVTTVALTMGHSSPAVTMRLYAHAMRQRQGDAERALDEVLAGIL